MIIPICTRDYRFKVSYIKEFHAKGSREAVQLCGTCGSHQLKKMADLEEVQYGFICVARFLRLDLFEARGWRITLIPQVPLRSTRG
jgi:hypothetical protein